MASPPRRRPSPLIRHDAATAADDIDFQAIVEATLDVIVLHGPDILATYISPSILSLIGRTPADMLGRCHMEHILPEDMPAVLRTIEAHEKGQMDGRVTFRMMHRNGSTVWVEGSGRVLKNPESGEDRWVVVLRDISDRKALQTQLSLLALTHAAPRADAPNKADRPRESGAPVPKARQPRSFN